MKYIIPLFLILSNSIWAQTHLSCADGKYSLNLELNKESDIHVKIVKGKNKISSCVLKITSFDDGKNSESLSELYRFQKSNCSNIYDKLASQVEIISTGYIKITLNSNSASAYLIKNKDPLFCNIINK